MDTSGYLRRINYNGVVYRDLATLRQLQHHHVFAIPFETLDIHNQVPILLQTNFLYQKVIYDNRGGYCYELNVLFHNLLTLTGFDVSMIGIEWAAVACRCGIWRFFAGAAGDRARRDPK
jgi:N-hydroxyarylamine O-acetyltransferase